MQGLCQPLLMLTWRLQFQQPAPGLRLEARVTCDPDLSASALWSLILSTWPQHSATIAIAIIIGQLP